MSPFPPLDLRRIATQGATLLFGKALQEVYTAVTGERPRLDPLALVDRLVREERLDPEAALHIVSIARALQEAGGFAQGLWRRSSAREHLDRLRDATEMRPFWQRR